ncbi:MAG: NnrU family protein [Pirellulales bacterium]|nr:hypothetical protein [Planctomycetales bacterium]
MPRRAVLRRVLGVAAGIGTHALFAVTVWYLFWFLKQGAGAATDGKYIVVDAGLAMLFALPHSLLLWPPVRRRLGRWVDGSFYGLLFTVVTCVTLLLLFAEWRESTRVLWEVGGTTATLVTACFYGSWVALLYSLHLTGLGYQTGLTPWLRWLRRQPQQRRGFQPRGAYRLFRHPVYLSFLGLIWFTPRMTADHAVLTAIWTVYIFLGSWLKDQRLAFYLGDAYRAYQARVPGYPMVYAGPLGCPADEVTDTDTPRPPSRRAA